MDVVAEAYFCHLFQASMAAHFHPLWFHELTPIVHVALFFTCIGLCVWAKIAAFQGKGTLV